ncbi:hypothetical protein C0993_012550 [Termitomyces sp. T159_Od127]|nr:hypothetical protein C0993_012550 [Termitomyces sp. T159_Od127]
MDDSNSYWWLVRVLKTQEVGYIPAENIETPFERLARLNKHRNVDLAAPTQAELTDSPHADDASPSPLPLGARAAAHGRSIRFGGPRFGVLRYPRAIWREDEAMDVDAADDESDWVELSEHEDAGLADEQPDDDPDDDPAPAPVPPPEEPVRVVEPPPVEDHRPIDPAEATETRKLTMTPTIARSDEPEAAPAKPKMAPPVSSAVLSKPKPRKDRESDDESSSGGKDKKKRSMFGGLFKSKKDKKEKPASAGSSESGDSLNRMSEDSLRAAGNRPSTSDPVVSPTTATAMQQQQQQALNTLRAAVAAASEPSKASAAPAATAPAPQTPERLPAVSQHASQLRQRDQHQQALYTQQYLTRSPSSPPEAQPSYGLQSASALSAYHTAGPGPGLGPPAPRARPGSLILTPAAGAPPTELSVIRVFAGRNLQTEATFKTVLLSSLTTSAELIRQAMQRFRLSGADAPGGGGDAGEEYYLTVKQVEGGAFAVLRPEEKPLGVFEQLVEAAMEMPTVKRSSVGSISSVVSDLSMHPAIRRLAMNDFTDDSAVKFYLNRRGEERAAAGAGGRVGGGEGEEGDETLIAAEEDEHVAPERFTSPSARFALQLVVYPEDLPDDMVFHPQTEAIVFRDTLRGVDAAPGAPTAGAPPAHMRRKVFVFPKNATVAEVIELGLERFGIEEGVVDGGDEVEDKTSKRRSATRVRYGLCVVLAAGSAERELAPSSRVIEAFPRAPPALRAPPHTAASKRRSADSALVLGTLDDVGADDPVFVLRRAMTYRNSTTRHRVSAPLDELALRRLHRDSASSASLADFGAGAGAGGEHASGSANVNANANANAGARPSRQEIIARQREASRATQRAIISAQTNPYRGMDVLLPGNAMLRSARYDAAGGMRYSYVDTDGEVYDISDIVEEELRGAPAAASPPPRSDLLESVLGRRDVGGERLGRVLSKIRDGRRERGAEVGAGADGADGDADARRSGSVSEYSVDTDTVASASAPAPALEAPLRATSPLRAKSRTPPQAEAARAVSPGQAGKPSTPAPAPAPADRRKPSIASVMSDFSGHAPQAGRAVEVINEDEMDAGAGAGADVTPQQSQPQRRVVVPPDDFGVAHMLRIIEYKDARPRAPLPPLDPVDALLFGRPLDLSALHPRIRDIYAPTFKQLEEMDKILDDYLGHILANS